MLARLRVRSDGQRGLLGLAASGDRVWAEWTPPDGRLVIARILPGPRRILWRGPPSATLANSGHLALGPGGELVAGIGDRQTRKLGSLFTVLPRRRTLSTGWNNPFAFSVGPDGALWVADNAPGDTGERLTRGDRGRPRPPITILRTGTAPSGLAVLDPRTLAVCGFRSGRLDLWRVGEGAPRRLTAARPLATDCRLGVARLGDGALVYSTGDALRVVRP